MKINQVKNKRNLFTKSLFLTVITGIMQVSAVTKISAQTIQRATVFDPPSNVRIKPNGSIICSVDRVRNINIYEQQNGWYKTDVCGKYGYIHKGQIRVKSVSPEEQAAFKAVLNFLKQEYGESLGLIVIDDFILASNYALFNYFRGEAGGMVTAKKTGGKWQILNEHGDDWGGSQRFVDDGIPRPITEQLLDQYMPGWREWE